VRFEDEVRNVDVVFDTMGGDIQDRSWKVLKRGGVLVSILNPPLSAPEGMRQAFVFVQPNSAQLTEIAKLVDSGIVEPFVEAVLPLSEARRAHELSMNGHTRGKLVLKVL
jgi:NADPH:quinone reductase-like Zn-dependent oxidoreductase